MDLNDEIKRLMALAEKYGKDWDTAPARCACGERVASECPGAWEQGCDLGANEKYVKVAEIDVGKSNAKLY